MFIWIKSSALGVALQEVDKALRRGNEEFMDELVQAFATMCIPDSDPILKSRPSDRILLLYLRSACGEISSDLYRLFVCDIEKSNY